MMDLYKILFSSLAFDSGFIFSDFVIFQAILISFIQRFEKTT
jgi:hypothetical protein